MRNQDPFLKWKENLLDRCNLHERDCTCKIFRTFSLQKLFIRLL
ncbi:Uncharacterized protein APZ42_030002 [Daphnia magna]|uniref:Uncharacterized protein n=1 Tax=Daphnia magna TaxID=35525 RepID=A0A164P525_9CRUS|nr:Uncharacterized protein APZ42_030002 [Daphnia magna]